MPIVNSYIFIKREQQARFYQDVGLMIPESFEGLIKEQLNREPYSVSNPSNNKHSRGALTLSASDASQSAQLQYHETHAGYLLDVCLKKQTNKVSRY